MTDRIHGLTVTLDRDIREDDVARIVEAIEMIRGVLTVAQHVANTADHLARERVRHEMRARLLKALDES